MNFLPDSSQLVFYYFMNGDLRTRNLLFRIFLMTETQVIVNVVYSCGFLIHNGSLILFFEVSDYSSTYAVVDLEELFFYALMK